MSAHTIYNFLFSSSKTLRSFPHEQHHIDDESMSGVTDSEKLLLSFTWSLAARLLSTYFSSSSYKHRLHSSGNTNLKHKKIAPFMETLFLSFIQYVTWSHHSLTYLGHSYSPCVLWRYIDRKSLVCSIFHIHTSKLYRENFSPLWRITKNEVPG